MNRMTTRRIFRSAAKGLAVLLASGLVADAQPLQNGTAAPAPTRAQTAAKTAEAPRPKPDGGAASAAPKTIQPAAGGGEIIARVAGTDIKEDEIRALVAGLNPHDQAAIAHDPTLLNQMVRALLANQLVLKEALAKHWEQQPDVAAQIEKAREATIVESYLRSLSVVPTDFPDEATLQNVYDANKSSFLVPRQFQIAQIFVALSSDADKASEDKAHKKLSDIQSKLKQPNADFSSVAHSDGDSKDVSEQDLGWVPETQLRPEIKAYVVGLSKGAVSEPIKLDDGWHIVKLLDTKPAGTRPFAEVKEQLAQRLREERANGMRRAYIGELLKQNPPAINELALSKVVVAPSP